MRKPTSALVGSAVTALTIFLIPMAPASAAPATRLVATTGTDSGTCLVTACQTINYAIGQAAGGDTVSIAAGSYAEAVVINKDLTLQGAKHGLSATSGRTDATQESIIAAPGGNDITYAAPAVTGTVDGVTLAGSGVGIVALSGGHGYTWTNNIIGTADTGINFMADGTVPTSITNNLIKNADPGGIGTGGVFFTSGPANNVTIENNRFDTNSTDVNTTSGGSGLVVRGNSSTGSGNFIALFQTTGALVTANTVSGATGTAFYLDGGNTGATVSKNTVSGGSGADGIQIGNAFYTASTGLTVSDNTVIGRRNGIVVRPSADSTPSLTGAPSTISGNTVTGAAQAGIVVLSGAAAGVAISANSASGSGTFDCQDDTTGAATSGTANVWTGDTGISAQPAGICSAPVATTPSPSPTASVTPSTGASSSVPVGGTAVTTGSGPALANTGAPTTQLVWIAVALLVSGLGVTARGRWRSAPGRHES